MISHKDCTHPSTPGARAKCRRARVKGEVLVGFQPPLYSLDARLGPKLASVKEVGRERNRGQTPRDKDKQCDICGVEKIAYRGTDPLNGILLTVGERCEYYVRHAEDLVALP